MVLEKYQELGSIWQLIHELISRNQHLSLLFELVAYACALMQPL
jgi:hypothetical protein